MSGAVFTHANIVARDPDRLAAFYVEVFGCIPSGPRRHLDGEGLERGMGLAGAVVDGVHLLLPGHGESGPTLEIFELPNLGARGERLPNQPGLMHLAFAVDDIEETLGKLLEAGGERLGEIAEARVKGVGSADFVYARDPDGNIIELQGWKG